MKFSITDDILRNAVKCNSNFSCLFGDEDCLCEVNDCSEEKVHFIVPGKKAGICDYSMVFGYSFTCNCPVRKDIYNKYKV